MSDANGHSPSSGPPPPAPRVWTAWGRDGVCVLFRKGTDRPPVWLVTGAAPDPTVEPLFTIEAADWEAAKALYFRRLAPRGRGRPL